MRLMKQSDEHLGGTAEPAPYVLDTDLPQPSPAHDPWLWAGARPYLLAADGASFLAVSLVVPGATGSDVAATAAGLLALLQAGLYRPRLTRSILDDVPRLCLAALVAGVAHLATSAATGTPSGPLGLFVVGVAIALVAVRSVCYALIVRARVNGRVRYRAIV